MANKKRVLMIDDDKWLSDLMAETLRRAGYKVDTAADSLAGIEQLNERQPDVIVLDMFMPGPNGIVLLHELQSHTDLARIPIILCTNSASDVSQEQLAAYGVKRILDKATMEPADVAAAVRRYA